MRQVKDFPREIVEHENMGITMPDGCRLSARVWMPVDAEENPVPINDLHATMLHLFGLDHLKLTYRFQGRDFRLTDVGGEVIPGWLA